MWLFQSNIVRLRFIAHSLHTTIGYWYKKMLKTKARQLRASGVNRNTLFIPLSLGIGLVTTAPAFAQSMTTRSIRVPYAGVVVERGYYGGGIQPNQATPFIYGSPIPTPMPVNPATGTLPSNRSYDYYYSNPGYSYPVRNRINNSTLINPTLVNPRINDSTLINPVIVNETPVYRVPVYEQRSPIIYFSN